ncbi:MAG: Transcriptional regulator of heat shock protein [Candidatus Uhrbacteria bacterium GW2011_GWE2_45_35]|uniref:Transcriptional regulator of heat shock protein n=2 Tax=Candidatus Uhriibacteriota TaxID=1752732 RepID=A0A0G1JKM2_9BACT|nr:MAG: Transcriptional regulator of heat shock protein [Candidatus Uhrbacteria bacterium GW2011_GWF2_44_350]KKU08777.1 MAG: Transcriptional regulator of heat shock protein [Candidatus Uhrbacteria bacterium GW2011_GWE2_45_35]
MDHRGERILRAIIEEYIRSAQPVGSKFLVERCGFEVSPATIRNEMVALEDEGYLRSPHPSAGRVPTEKAYEYYLRNFVGSKPGQKISSRLRQAALADDDDETKLKKMAKILVDISGETAIVAFGPHHSYYTGVSNLFQKPDFQNLEVLQGLSSMVDRFDEVVTQIFDQIAVEPQIMIGQENPFGDDMAAILVKYQLPNKVTGFLGLLGPLRMDYQKNLTLIEGVREILGEE